MNYYEPEDPYADPYGGGMDDQMMIDFLIANGVGAGLLPQVQPSGRQMTTSNITSALSANRSGLFDTAFQGGMGGADAFAPGAFEPTVSTSVKQTPELQQMYGYLRAPDSYEGLIANEILNGGNASTALRKIRELLASEATDPALKESLLLELPQREVDYGMPAPELAPENVNWDAGETSVAGRAREINELYAQIPRVGPSGPQWGTDPQTGQPVQISAGGELQWGEDETGAPVLIETTVTPSEAAQTFTDLGLPTPDQEYMAEDFMTPDQVAMQQAYAETEDPVAQLKAAWMDPSLAPGNEYAPQRPQGAIPNLTPEQLAGQPLSAASEPRYNFPTGLNEPGGAVVNAPGPGDVQTTAAQLLPHDPGAISQFMQQVYPTLDRATQDALAGYLTDSGQGDVIPAQPRSVMEQGGQALAAPDILPEDPGAVDEWMRTVYPTLARGDQDAVDAYLATQQGGGGPAGQSIGVTELMRRRAAGYAPAEQPPPVPGPDDYAAGDPATYEEFLAQQAATNPSPGVGAASGGPFSINLAPAPQPAPDYATSGSNYRQQQAELTQPDYATSGSDYRQQQAETQLEAMLRQLLPGNQQRSTSQPPDWPQQRLPSGQVQQTGPTGREDWMRAQTLTGAGGGQGSNAMPGTPYWGAGGGGNQAMSDAMLAQLLPGNEQRSTSLRAYNQQGATPAPQPGGPAFMEEIETGERRAAQRQEDERNASVLGGSTDRTGRRVRPTRTGEQARRYRAAFDAWDQATDEQQRMKQAAHTYETGQAMGQAWIRQQQGVRPLDQAMMARRLVMMNAGVPQGI